MTSYTVPVERSSKPCRFRNLTQLEIKTICNGCGAKGGWFKVLNYGFTASCNHHDFNWWLGGNRSDLDKSNRQFLKEMLHDSWAVVTHYLKGGHPVFKLRPFWKRWWYKGAAYRYYYAVTFRQSKFVVGMIGKGTFNFHPPENQGQQWARLERYMDAHGAKPDEALWDREDWK